LFWFDPLLEYGSNVAAAVDHVENQNIITLDAVKDNVVTHRNATQSDPQIVAPTTQKGMFRKRRNLSPNRASNRCPTSTLPLSVAR
jgi:hypothetical protein